VELYAMPDLSPLISRSFDVVSLVLVFVFVLFDIRYPQITQTIKKEIPDKAREKDRRFYRDELQKCLLQKNLPLVLIYGVLTYLLLPLLVGIFAQSRIDLWNFDLLRTGYLVVFLFVLAFFLWSVWLGVRLVVRINASRE
jgi:hypothetical protein